MVRTLKLFSRDEAGFIVSAELVLIATILVIGMIVGLSEVQTAVVHELNDVANSIGSLNQSYSFRGFTGCKAVTVGSKFQDNFDVCDNNGQNSNDLCAYSSVSSEGDGLGGHHHGHHN